MDRLIQTISQRWRHLAQTEGKRLWIVAALLVVGVLLWGRLIILEKIPRTGYAEPEAGGTASGEEETGKAMLPPAIQTVELPSLIQREAFTYTDQFHTGLGISNDVTVADVTESAPEADEVVQLLPTLEEVSQEAQTKLRLESVLLGESPLAIVNGRVCRVGSRLDGFTVIAIGSDSITVSRHGFEIELRLPQR